MNSRSRTSLFRSLAKIVGQAGLVQRRPELKNAVQELVQAQRVAGQSEYSRREFLRMLGQAGILTAAASVIPIRRAWAKPVPSFSVNDVSVAVVGAGFAGLTAALRLSQHKIAVELFEAQNRSGGRVFTKDQFNRDGMFCELGGELINSVDEDLLQLCAELGVATEVLGEGDAGVAAALYFFGGKYYTDEELIPAFQPFAERLAKDKSAVRKAPNGFYNAAAQGIDRISIAEYLKKQGAGVDAWVLKLLDVAYAGEFGLSTDQQSALSLVKYVDSDTSKGFRIFGDFDQTMRIRGGNSRLTEALTLALDRQKVKVQSGHLLTAIRQSSDQQIELIFTTEAGTKTKKFPQVVLALPFTLLREVDGVDRLALTPFKKRCIGEFSYGTNVKIMTGYEEKYWRRSSLPGVPASNGNIYSDLKSLQYWDTSQGQKGSSGILTNFISGPWGAQYADPEDKLSNDAKLAVTVDDLNRILPGIKAIRDPKSVATFSWPTHRFSKGSYLCPKVGQITTILKEAGTPELDKHLFFAGEHTSPEFNGFMNGAVESGNRVAREIAESRNQSAAKTGSDGK